MPVLSLSARVAEKLFTVILAKIARSGVTIRP
jgi:hypothetical protein